jgi:hypothetical protein
LRRASEAGTTTSPELRWFKSVRAHCSASSTRVNTLAGAGETRIQKAPVRQQGRGHDHRHCCPLLRDQVAPHAKALGDVHALRIGKRSSRTQVEHERVATPSLEQLIESLDHLGALGVIESSLLTHDDERKAREVELHTVMGKVLFHDLKRTCTLAQATLQESFLRRDRA